MHSIHRQHPPGFQPPGAEHPHRARWQRRTACLSLLALLPLALPPQANATCGASEACVPQGCITLKKEISVDGRKNYYDANTPADAVRSVPPRNAHYRLTVRNCGTTALDRVKISDPAIGIYGVKTPGSPTGRLVPGQEVIITSDSAGFGKLFAKNRCTQDGTYPNVAGAEGFVVKGGVTTGTGVRDDDAAYLVCKTQQPAVGIEKQVRLPGGAWVDADTADAAVVQSVGAGVEYQFVVSNVGSGALTNIRVSDADLAIQDAVASNLLTYGKSVTVTAATPGFQNLDQIGRCTAAGDLLNTAMVTASARSNPALVVSAQDPAWVKCEPVAGNPAIEIKKQISFDNATWSDADTLDNPLQGTFPQDVFYRFLITNTGDEILENLLFNDQDLGLDDVALANVALRPGAEVGLTYLQSGFEALKQPNRCTAAGTFTNTAQVYATSQVDGAPVSDDDAAILVCFGTPEIDLQKQVSVDGGITWLDADTDADAVATPVGNDAQYRFLIENVGTQAIDGLAISDPSLSLANVGITGGTLDPSETRTVTSTDEGFAALDQPARCSVAGNVTNTATVYGLSVDTNTPVSDTDSAVVRCEEPANPPAIEIRKQVSVDGGTTWVDADTTADAVAALVGQGVRYRLLVKNTGGEAIINPVVNDPTLGLNDVAIFGVPASLPVGTTVELDSSVEDFEALDQPNRCAVAGDVNNTATVSGTSMVTSTSVSNTDSAVVRCEQPPAAANCSVCSGLNCLDPIPAPLDCASGQDVCTVTVSDSAAGREIARACAVRADALVTAGQNPEACANVEISVQPGAVCTFVCDGVTNPNCNRPPSLLPVEGVITP